MPKTYNIAKALTRHIRQLPTKIFTEQELSQIITDFSIAVSNPLNIETTKWIDHLVNENLLNRILLEGTNKKVVRYLPAGYNPSPDEIGLSLKSQSYITHHSAAYFHKLVKKDPSTIYINYEQPPKEKIPAEIEQESIDYAFTKPQRKSGTTYKYNRRTIMLINGKFTNQLGVTEKAGIPLTNPERTLLDMSVRPSYSGGAVAILTAYQEGRRQNISPALLINYLDKLEFVYPYHQVIGFFLERAGFDGKEIMALANRKIEFDFYVDYDIKQPNFDKKWQVYYPREIDRP